MSRPKDFSAVDRLAARDLAREDRAARRLSRINVYRQPPAWALSAIRRWKRLVIRFRLAPGLRPHNSLLTAHYPHEVSHGPS